MMGNGYGPMWMGGWWMWLIWIGLIVLVVWLVSSLVSGRRSSPGKESALEILERRYASGEIGGEEFERMREKLRK